jgi:hypothetical protein
VVLAASRLLVPATLTASISCGSAQSETIAPQWIT